MKKAILVLFMLAAVISSSCNGGKGTPGAASTTSPGELTATPQLPLPGTPQNVSAQAGEESVTVSWDAVPNATSYNLYWLGNAGVTKANGTKIAQVASPYIHLNLTGGTAYFYVVTAVSDNGESEDSAQVSATALHLPLKMFTTSVIGNGNLSSWRIGDWSPTKAGIAAADEICGHLAAAANLKGDFKAWLSDSNDDAYCRLHNLTGKKSAKCGQAALPAVAGPWTRTDGLPFGAKIDELLDPNFKVYTPPKFNENGQPIQAEQKIYTGTNAKGEGSGANCHDWSDSGARTFSQIGMTTSTAKRWTDTGQANCSNLSPLMCFQSGEGAPLAPFAAQGKKVFLTSTKGTGNLGSWPQAQARDQSGMQGADIVCQALADDAQLGGTYKAWISNGQADAIDRIQWNGPWVRLDGIKIADTKNDLMNANIISPINVTERGQYMSDDVFAWTGTLATGRKSPNNCTGWSTADPGVKGTAGSIHYMTSVWTDFAILPNPCGMSNRLYCFEE